MSLQPHHQRISTRLTQMTGSCLILIFLLFSLTRERVKDNEAAYLRASLSKVLPAGLSLSDFDSDVLTARQLVDQRVIYPICQNGILRYVLTEITTDQGYSGTIRLLANIDVKQQRLFAVRPLFHQETPGLGDQIDVDKSDWLKQFALSLKISTAQIAIKRDRGKIDAIVGATITSRAVSNVIAKQIFSVDWQKPQAICNIKSNSL